MTVKGFKIYSKEVSESRNYGGKWKKMLETMGYSNKYGDVVDFGPSKREQGEIWRKSRPTEPVTEKHSPAGPRCL
jgi:hypothetical protein